MEIIVNISDAKVSYGDDTLLTHSLGSCIGLCLYDTTHNVAGLGHFLLPKHPDLDCTVTPYKYVDSGTTALYESMLRVGAHPRCISARIAGGAAMFANLSRAVAIGAKNIEQCFCTLDALHIPVSGADVGKNYGRTIVFYVRTGKMHIRFFLPAEVHGGPFQEMSIEL